MFELKQIEEFYPENLRHFKRYLLREYLQYKILASIFTHSLGKHLVFMGGTAIHIIHGLARFSEDLDFDNQGLSKADFRQLSSVIVKSLILEGYTVESAATFKQAFSADIKITGILYESGLSGHREEKILIKLDAEPQNFKYTPQRAIINKFDVFAGINVVPVDILLAQKFCAILKRKRSMGRDFYDAVFLSGKAKPNLAYLKVHAGIKDIASLRDALIAKCKTLDFKTLANDVKQFLFVPSDTQRVLLFEEYVKEMK